MSRITIVYENHPHPSRPDLETAHGFSALVELANTKILFDTGWDGGMLLRNCQKLGVNLQDIDAIFISHEHWDHMGGLVWVLQESSPKYIYIPSDFSKAQPEEYVRYVPDVKIIRVGERRILHELSPGIISTGTWKTTGRVGEHALVIPQTDSPDNLLLVGCLHPGLKAFVTAAESKMEGKIQTFIGGMHGFDDVDYLNQYSNSKNICGSLYPTCFLTTECPRSSIFSFICSARYRDVIQSCRYHVDRSRKQARTHTGRVPALARTLLYISGNTQSAIDDFRATLKIHINSIPAVQALQDLGLQPITRLKFKVGELKF